jgi:hypothetical protein
MIIVKEKEATPLQPLEEMAQFKGAGITVEVRSHDHGILGSPGDPAHVHVFDSSGSKELAEIILTEKPPKKTSDVFYYRTSKIPDGLSRAIVKFARMPDRTSKRSEMNLTNWQGIIYQWIAFHGK